MDSTTAKEIVQELHSIELPWDDVLPRNITEWLDIFSSSHNVVKEIMFPGILTSLSGLMAPKTKLKMSPIELEPVNLFTIVLAPPGSGKSAALQAAVNGPILALEEHCDAPVLIEDFSKHGVFLHLKETEGVGVFARDEVHVFVESLLSSSKNKELFQDLLIKFFDNAPWTVNKGNTAKRDRIPHTALSFFGLSQPDSFLETYRKMAKKGNGLVDRILCCCPLPRRLTRGQLNDQVDRLQQCFIQNLNSLYEYVYHHHQDTIQPVVYTLSKDALDFFSKQEQQLVDAQNEIFSGKGDIEVARNISKAAKLMLRLGVALHVFIDRMTQALGQNGARDIPTVIEVETMQRAVALANWFLDSRYILEKTLKKSTSGTTDPFGVCKKIIQAPGPFVTSRIIARRFYAMSGTVIAAMEKLESEGLGTIDHDLKCFFKSVPIFVSEERLQLYGVNVIEYSRSFRTKDGSLSRNQWDVMILHAPNQRELLRYFPN